MMRRWIVYWNVQDPVALPPWPACAGHRETMKGPIEAVKHLWPEGADLIVKEVAVGKCAFAAFGNCCDDPVEAVPSLDVSLLEGGA